MTPATDVEIDRVLNAITVTLNDQPSADASVPRLQEIADGATAHQRRLSVRALSPNSFALDDAETHRHVATAERDGGCWRTRREREAHGSPVGVPGEEHDR